LKIKDELVFLDGAMGTSLAFRGLDPTALSTLKHPDAVKEITKGYIEAGSDIIETNTFQALPAKFPEYADINREAVRIAKQAVKESGAKNVKIAGSIGPTGKMVKPVGELEFEQAVDIFRSQIKILNSQGVDLLVIETMDDISEMRAALIASKETAPQLPVIATMTFSEHGRTSTGTPAEVAARVMDSLGALAVGVNCSFGPEGLIEIVRRMRRVTKKPIAAQANAGLPRIENRRTVYPLGPVEYAKLSKNLVRSGASYIGGCCGTTKEHIRALKKELKNITPPKPYARVPLIITSRSRWTEFDAFPVIIGERINFIAHPKLKDSHDALVAEAVKQKNAGADALDVNLGRDEQRAWEVVDTILRKTGLPVVLDSQDPETVEKVARKYPGVLLLNSVSAEKSKLDSLLPVAKKYGIPFIGLCVDDKGVPKTVREKLDICKKIISAAKARSMDENNIVIDPVTLSISTDTDSAAKTLKALQKIKNPTVLGISNVSSGFPQRALLNEIFSALAAGSGCSALIANPLDADLMYCVYASALLSGRDRNGKRYVDFFSAGKETFSFKDPLSQSVLEGNISLAESEARNKLKKIQPLKIINGSIVPALNKVGQLYSERKIFLPQLIESAKACRKAMAVINRGFAGGKHKSKKAKILIATVKGDIHDIGKNLVVLMLENHSFEVRDIGVDADSKKIISEAKKFKPDILALSALMTTTMERMAEVAGLLQKENITVPVMVGGAAVTEKYARSIGAHYGRDAVDAVRVAEILAPQRRT
jgi:5-methyltetrahydrofolate--homocysteine methyltransferase